MAFSISALVLFGLLLFLLIRFKAVGAGSAVVGVLFGYYLAGSPIGPTVDDLMAFLGRFVGAL